MSRRTAKSEAQSAVARAIKDGVLQPATTQRCLCCGEEADKHHHWSYEPDHWLDVAPVCNSCHAKVHAGRIPDPTSGRTWDGTRKPRAETRRSRDLRDMYGDALRHHRTALGLTQTAAGKLAGMTGGAWQQLEAGHNAASEETLHRMFGALGLRLTLTLAEVAA